MDTRLLTKLLCYANFSFKKWILAVTLQTRLEGRIVDSDTTTNDDEPKLVSVDPINPEIIWIFDVLYEVCTNIEQGIPTRPNTERDVDIFYSRVLFRILTDVVDLHL